MGQRKDQGQKEYERLPHRRDDYIREGALWLERYGFAHPCAPSVVGYLLNYHEDQVWTPRAAQWVVQNEQHLEAPFVLGSLLRWSDDGALLAMAVRHLERMEKEWLLTTAVRTPIVGNWEWLAGQLLNAGRPSAARDTVLRLMTSYPSDYLWTSVLFYSRSNIDVAPFVARWIDDNERNPSLMVTGLIPPFESPEVVDSLVRWVIKNGSSCEHPSVITAAILSAKKRRTEVVAELIDIAERWIDSHENSDQTARFRVALEKARSS